MQSDSVGPKSSQSIPIFQVDQKPFVAGDGEPISVISQQVLGKNSSQESSSPSSKSINAASYTSDSSSSIPRGSSVLKRPRITENFFTEPLEIKEGLNVRHSNSNLSNSEGNSTISVEKVPNSKPNIKSNYNGEAIEDGSNLKSSRKFLEVPKLLSRKTSSSRFEFSSKVSNEHKSRESHSISKEPSPRVVSFIESDERKSCSQMTPGRNLLASTSTRNNQEYIQKKIEKKNQGTTAVAFRVLCSEVENIPLCEYHFNILVDIGVNFSCSEKLSNAELVEKAWNNLVLNFEEVPEEIDVNGFKLSLINLSSLVPPTEFWNILFKCFYAHGFDDIDPNENEVKMNSNKEASLMFLYCNDGPVDCQFVHDSCLKIEDLSVHVPCLKIVEAMLDNNFAMDSWYLKSLFPYFFSKYNSPYFLESYSKICRYNIHIAGGSRFQIEKIKKINIMRYGEVNKIATITYTCVEKFSESVQEPSYVIKDINCKVHEDEHWENIMSIIANPTDIPNCKKTNA